jgi:hypothetical protein
MLLGSIGKETDLNTTPINTSAPNVAVEGVKFLTGIRDVPLWNHGFRADYPKIFLVFIGYSP